MQKWEYKVVEADRTGIGSEEQLNSLGKEGWELVSVTAVMMGPFVSKVFYLKRPVD